MTQIAGTAAPMVSAGLDDFVRRVRDRAAVSDEEAARGTRAVFSGLRTAVTGGEFRHVMSQLPSEFQELVAPVHG
ncbi:DUF2267 domain-containing protein [Streptomyces sp. NPDC001296]